MSIPLPPQTTRSSGDGKKTPPSSIVTRNGARKAKIQTRAMSAGTKPSASVIAAKKKAQQKKKLTVDTVLRDPYQIAMESKSKVKGPTGFVTEPRMAEHRCLWDDKYPECPERLIGVINRCQELNLIEQCVSFPPRAATKEELHTLHSPSIHEMLEATHQNQDEQFLEDLSSKYDAVYIHPSTHELALIAAGSTIDMVDRIVTGVVQNGAAFVRPPGHHAMRAEPCGYCFYNNVALAAHHALSVRHLQRILIIDWDVHHGQATQQMFYDDPRVVYFSIHRYEHGAFWPNLRQSNFHYTGCGRGEGYTFNVPLNQTGMTDADYIAIWHQLLLPMAIEYQPELVLISAGYDAAVGCPEGEMEVTPACYATLLNMVMSVCPSVCVVLEGGYCVRSLAEAAALTLRTLLGHPPPRLQALTEPNDSIRESILNCIYAHKKHWRCYNYQPTYSIDTTVVNVCDRDKQKHTVSVRWEGDETRPERFATRDCYPLQDDATKQRIREKLDHLSIVTDLTLAQHPVCYIFDHAMLKHRNICEPGHVESPERILRIHERHRDFGLLDRLHHLTARTATDEEILAVHTRKHLDRLKELASTKLRDLNSLKEAYDSIYFHPDTLESAAVAAGCVLQMVDAVLSNVAGSGVCVIRPPGHHADDEIPSGFCLLNNAAIAAKYAIQSHGLQRVLIVDWDVHHGNGTQKITYKDKEILYISVHRYDNGSFFPHSRDADYTAVGEGRGEGYNVNVPWNKRGMGDAEYMAAFTQVVLPIAYEYNPDLVLVSAGFDACVGDPLGGCKVSPECYGQMTHLLKGLAGGRIILCLEGGYNVTSISYAMTMCTKALLGDPILHYYEPKHTVHWSAVESINNVIKTHEKYWKSLKFHLALPVEDVLEKPAPSRGLITNSLETPSHLNDSKKSEIDTNLECSMSNLSLEVDNKCADGIHCGSDDEDVSCAKSIAGSDSKVNESSPKLSETSSKGNENATKVNEDRSKVNEGESKVNEGASKVNEGESKVNESASKVNEVASKVNEDASKENESEMKATEPTTLVDFLSENMQAIVDGDMFAVVPLQWCPHLDMLYAIPEGVNFEQGVKCVDCDHTEENWVCLHCYITACGRHINGHMQAHYRSSGHALALSLVDLSAWCSACDAYVDNALLYDAKNNAHRCKFGEDMPWCYKTDIHME
ncbi:histone deacetylase 6 isoform X1 [Maniola jurtina]|uniref:histone deacetylase 6 isoform X1 n=1 Tax=Maniola jurtina TaxID=191418 RepID=UPI001E68756A|nr:histone deacetylase 6 isoform X1 [Maniola jurtina]XP_045775805.1 histone deacetylase 6 isoform X1 [Maniola jurtina]